MSTQAKPILYSYWRSTASWRVRNVLSLKNVDYEYRGIDLFKEEHKNDSYKLLNPMGRVPTLIIDGVALAESVAIMEYLDETYKYRPLLPSDPLKRASTRQLVEIINSAMQPMQNIAVLDKIGNEYKQSRKEWASFWLHKGLAAYEQILKQTAGKYSVGDQITLADACIVPQVAACSRFDISLERYLLIQRVVGNLNELEEFKRARPEAQPDADKI
ncbi:hypothetical protein FGO68_gene966 [Halteria grandinella]|uniref:Maleylacetoacetate isomerase n=1 Tax=Halteria grandinella TaxID=5974 RepID=A0A8J8SZ49_HALGN|nr:hypothetical protein FGO68_gene966 [Halteria grandinella]